MLTKSMFRVGVVRTSALEVVRRVPIADAGETLQSRLVPTVSVCG